MDYRKAPRSKSEISHSQLLDLMKTTMKCTGNEFLIVDEKALLNQHAPFFEAVAEYTTRLNAVAVAKVAQELFQMDNNQAKLFGTAVHGAMAYCKKAGDQVVRKGTTGGKLGEDVASIYGKFRHGSSSSFESTCTTLAVKKSEPENRQLKRELKTCISSPDRVSQLYSLSMKQEPQQKVVTKEVI